jgi:hypothetical protein
LRKRNEQVLGQYGSDYSPGSAEWAIDHELKNFTPMGDELELRVGVDPAHVAFAECLAIVNSARRAGIQGKENLTASPAATFPLVSRVDEELSPGRVPQA